MARSSGGSAGVVVAGLTTAALAVIGFFAYQASAAQEHAEKPSTGKTAKPSPGSSDGKNREPAQKETALPDASGQGHRVVYSLKRQRVWLVDKDSKVTRTYTVSPSSVTPEPGTYKVTSRSSHVTGSDGVPVENVVRFAGVDGVTIGFSAALDGSTPTPDAARKTGGIREKREDGEALWLHAPIGTRVVVVR
ncbi:L,D-transpeptidase [Streptomyces sp. 891-h]|uniref:L,D-transpeptidase n=1 Tax=unclassified Streptomyces TaxID=2593676 RepID=UPI001FAB0F60|nr:L,D-transpeptidase [Streptomyces sp. 891-h]UNZ17752.1 L,D-transpeptidase [Streptomyces sp. 891-h]